MLRLHAPLLYLQRRCPHTGDCLRVLTTPGVTELHPFDPSQLTDQDAGPTPPNLTTLNIDLTGVLYTTRLALWYFAYHDKREDPGLRAITLTGSMSSFYGSYGVNYSVAKA